MQTVVKAVFQQFDGNCVSLKAKREKPVLQGCWVARLAFAGWQASLGDLAPPAMALQTVGLPGEEGKHLLFQLFGFKVNVVIPNQVCQINP